MEQKNNPLVKLIAISAGVIFALGVVIIAFISGEQNAYNQKSYDEFKNNQPQSVKLESGLVCNKLDSPLNLDTTTVIYTCQAPGAYLQFVDVDKLEATQVTTDTDFYTVISAPTTLKVEILN